ncbi:MAG: hypothetical protein NTW29_10625 [Bacteroidetes bacterium]|nr:hypothetical protein [Bacteroidota bacterium]
MKKYLWLKKYLIFLSIFEFAISDSSFGQKLPLPKTFSDKAPCFQNITDTLRIIRTELESIFTRQKDAKVNITTDHLFHFSGTVNSVVHNTDVTTIIIKSDAFTKTLFLIHRTNAGSGMYKYSGRIISTACRDGFELMSGDNESFMLVRKSTDFFISE